MRHRPDGDYNWIGHYMDHWSKIHVLFPLTKKSALEVSKNLSSRVFAYFGFPKVTVYIIKVVEKNVCIIKLKP